MFSRRSLLAMIAVSPVCAQKRESKLFDDAEAYERFMGRWSRSMAAPLVEFANIPDRGRVLDVGSGTGALAFTIAEKKPHCEVVGIDPSQEYVAYASQRSRFGKRTAFEVGDAQQMHFRAGEFENSLSLLVFNFIPDPGKALREVVRVTKPGGHVAAAVWDYGKGMGMLRTFWDAVVATDPAAEKLDEKHMPLCREGELATLWKSGGLAEVEEQPLEVAMRFQSFADYWDPFLLGQGPGGAYVKKLDPARADRLRDALKRRLPAAAQSGPFELQARVWAVRGTVRK